MTGEKDILIDLVKALEGMLAHACVADADPRDKDQKDHAAERNARSALARAKQQLDLDRAEHWRHKKRGTEYQIIGDVRVQCETPLQDDEVILLYQSMHNGSYGCRRHVEFNDGRFERITLHPTTDTPNG